MNSVKKAFPFILGLILLIGPFSQVSYPKGEDLPMGGHKITRTDKKNWKIITPRRERGKTENERKEEEKLMKSLDLIKYLIIDLRGL